MTLVIGLVVSGCAHATTSGSSEPSPNRSTDRSTDRSIGRRIDSGPIVGREHDGVARFLGIPYAAPPVGARRWRPPAPVARWTAPRDATRAGHDCAQLAGDADHTLRGDEDCLTLDVWAGGRGSRRPVLVFIHGGAFVTGAGSDDLYDGARLAARTGSIVVTLNYRLGALGFLSSRELADEAGMRAFPSLGILDQRAALAWVQRNIAAFGGDAGNVTLFGESAGAWSSCVHLASPGSRGLFARVIMESGGCAGALYFTPAAAEAQAAQLAARLGCTGATTLACLRAKSPLELAGALPMKRGLILPPGVWWGPVVDGVVLPRSPLAQLRAGEFARVPVIVGANHDEGSLHTARFAAVTNDDVDDFVRDSFGAAAIAPVRRRYARATPAKDALTAIVGDGIFVCPARRVARAVAAAGVPAFLYHFAHALDAPGPHELGATHTVELFFVFGNASMGVGLSAREQPLADAMMDAWGAFARRGDPSVPSQPWPRYRLERDENLTLDLPARVESGLNRQTCDFWDALESAD